MWHCGEEVEVLCKEMVNEGCVGKRELLQGFFLVLVSMV